MCNSISTQAFCILFAPLILVNLFNIFSVMLTREFPTRELPTRELPTLTLSQIVQNGFPKDVRQRYGMFILDLDEMPTLATNKTQIFADIRSAFKNTKSIYEIPFDHTDFHGPISYTQSNSQQSVFYCNDKRFNETPFANHTVPYLVQPYRKIVRILLNTVKSQINLPSNLYNDFSGGFDDNTFRGTLSQIYYNSNNTTPKHGLHVHTDFDFFTLLFSDKPGLVVMDRETKEFFRVKFPKENSILVFFGRALSYATRNFFEPAVHYVEKITEDDRVAVGYFAGPKLNSPLFSYDKNNNNLKMIDKQYDEYLVKCFKGEYPQDW